MDLFKDISESEFVMVLLPEQQYDEKLTQIVKHVDKRHEKICYVCLSKPYTQVIDDLKGMELDITKFFFIDVLTRHYNKTQKVDNCFFIDDPRKLVAIEVGINKAVVEKGCSTIIFDTISSLLMYEQSENIIKFTHHLTIEKKHEDINKVYIVLKEQSLAGEYANILVKDIQMFTDKTIDINNAQ